jgi:zinc protease
VKTNFSSCRWLAATALLASSLLASATPKDSGYAVVVSRQTQADPGWNRVVEALRQEHQAKVIAYEASVDEALTALRAQFPRYVCFVAQPAEAGREFVAKVHRLTRKLDDDPFADCLWGILTGYDADNALRIAQHRAPLTVNKAAGGTEIALECCQEGVWYSESTAGLLVKKEKGGEPKRLSGPADSTEALAKALTEYQADLFVTSGHATERDWQIGYAYRNGQFRCEGGVLYGLDTQGRKLPIRSPNPKVYLPIGNCLMGHIYGPDAMALAFMNSGGVNQMIGYTVPSWYGYAGWGCLDYFVEQPGRYTFAEAFFANQAALVARLQSYFPDLVSVEPDAKGRLPAPVQVTAAASAAGLTANDARGLVYDRDTVAFYGDPAWVARMAKGQTAWDQTLTEREGVWTFEIKPNRGLRTFDPINRNGSQRGGRPIVQFLPRRLKDVQILEGADLKPLITDDFVLVPNPRTCDPARNYRVVFRGTPCRQPQ